MQDCSFRFHIATGREISLSSSTIPAVHSAQSPVRTPTLVVWHKTHLQQVMTQMRSGRIRYKAEPKALMATGRGRHLMRSGVLGPIPHGGNPDRSSSHQPLSANTRSSLPEWISGFEQASWKLIATCSLYHPLRMHSQALVRSTVIIAPEYADELYGLGSDQNLLLRVEAQEVCIRNRITEDAARTEMLKKKPGTKI